MTDDDRAFTRAILDRPGEDAPRLVYADRLEEDGRAGHAEYLRLEIRLRTYRGWGRRRLLRPLDRLRAGLDPEWVASVGRASRIELSRVPPFTVAGIVR